MGIAPAAFWKLSLKEWNMIVASERLTAQALSGAELAVLCRRFPDTLANGGDNR